MASLEEKYTSNARVLDNLNDLNNQLARIAEIERLKQEIEQEKLKQQVIQEDTKRVEEEKQKLENMTQKLIRKVKVTQNKNKELEEKYEVAQFGGSMKLADMNQVNVRYVTMIEEELERVDLSIMSIGDLSRLTRVFSKQLDRVNDERDKREKYVLNKLDNHGESFEGTSNVYDI
jgi:predicted nuclease with TOPRIM domain